MAEPSFVAYHPVVWSHAFVAVADGQRSQPTIYSEGQ
jgi:hypothetical protein